MVTDDREGGDKEALTAALLGIVAALARADALAEYSAFTARPTTLPAQPSALDASSAPPPARPGQPLDSL